MEPYLASAVLGATALAGCEDEALRHEWLQAQALGQRRLAFAHEEAGVAVDDAQLRAHLDSGAWRLDGAKCAVVHAAAAQALVVTARAAPGSDGIGLFLVAANAAGPAPGRTSA